MIIKELMDILKKFDPDTEVIASSNVNLGRRASRNPNDIDKAVMDAEWHNITGHYDLSVDLMDENGKPDKLLALYIDRQDGVDIEDECDYLSTEDVK